MRTRKLLLPAISVGMLVTPRPAMANPIDLGIVAEQLILTGTLRSAPAVTLGTYTMHGQEFVGSDLNLTLNSQTVSDILAADIGAPNAGTMAFSFSGAQGASGNMTFSGSYGVVGGNVELAQNTFTMGLTSCTPNEPASALPGCAAPNGVQGMFDPYSPSGVGTELTDLQVLSYPGSFYDTGLQNQTVTLTLDLGSVGINEYQAEVLQTTTSVTADAVPEPPTWSLAALGLVILGWLRRRAATKA